MKGKRKTFGGFFFSAFASFLAFCIAAMAGFTYLAALRQREADAAIMSNASSRVAKQQEQIRQTEKDTQEKRLGDLTYQMLAEKYCTPANLKAELVLYGDGDRPLLAATENYWNVTEGHTAGPTHYFIDMDRWLSDEERQTIEQMMIDDWNMQMWGPHQVGDIVYNFLIDGWQDGQMIIPHKIYLEKMRIEHVYENGWSATQYPEEDTPALFEHQPEGAETKGLPYKVRLFGSSNQLNGLTNRGNGPPEISYQEWKAYRDDPERAALRKSLYATGPETADLAEPGFEPNAVQGLWKLQMIYKQQGFRFGQQPGSASKGSRQFLHDRLRRGILSPQNRGKAARAGLWAVLDHGARAFPVARVVADPGVGCVLSGRPRTVGRGDGTWSGDRQSGF